MRKLLQLKMDKKLALKKSTEPILVLKNVCRSFRMDGVLVEAVCGINLTVNKGDFLSIVGPSGSGKSTLMYLIGLLDRPTSGEIIIDNQRVDDKLAKDEIARIRNREIGFVFQSFNLLPRTSALANVSLPLIYAGVPQEKRIEIAKSLLVKLGLENRLFHFPNQLSGGQQQRVAIARALSNNPNIILADEPTGNVDTKSGEEIMKIFHKLNDEGKTIIIVTHNLEIAKKTKKIVKIVDGKIVS